MNNVPHIDNQFFFHIANAICNAAQQDLAVHIITVDRAGMMQVATTSTDNDQFHNMLREMVKQYDEQRIITETFKGEEA